MYLNYNDKIQDYWIIDIEANSLTPDVIWCVVVKNFLSGEVKVFENKDAFNEWYSSGRERILLGHNILSFDAVHLNSLWGAGIELNSCICTLTLSYLYNPALEGGHSLKSWGIRLGKLKSEWNEWDKYTPEMLEYCKQDVEVTHELYKQLSAKMRKLGFSEKSCEIEHKIRIIIDEQQNNGFWFNRECADEFRKKLRHDQHLLAEQIQKLFPPNRTSIKRCVYKRNANGSAPARFRTALQKYHDVELHEEEGYYECFDLVSFNLGSPLQRVRRLLEMGWKPDKFTKTKTDEFPEGFPKVDEEALIRLSSSDEVAPEYRDAIRALADWLVIQGRASMLDTWFNNLGSDSRIHGRVNTCGATTRRMIHSLPNSANIPSGAKAKYGHECRSFWGVEPNKGLVLVGCDASGLENVGLLHYLPDKYREEAVKVLNQKKPNDIHSLNSRKLTELLGREVDREWGAKTSYYATIYGAYPAKLASIVKGPTSDGELVQEVLFNSVPGLKDVISESQREWKSSSTRLLCIDGGFVVCPNVSASLNYRIQSLGAIVMKLACVILHEEAEKQNLWFKLCGFIHDEWQMYTKTEDGERLGKLAVWSIEEAARQLNFKVPLSGEFKIGLTWNDTH